MHPMAPITQHLQNRAVDVVSAYTEVKDCAPDLDYLRNLIKDEFSKIYQQGVKIVMKLSVTPSIPQTTIRQQHHNNIPSENPGENYRRATAIPLLNRLTQEIKFRFTKFSKRVSTLLCFIPSIICSPDMNLDFHNVVSKYKEDLPNHEIADQDICS